MSKALEELKRPYINRYNRISKLVAILNVYKDEEEILIDELWNIRMQIESNEYEFEKGVELGRLEVHKESLINLLKNGYSKEQISEIFKVDIQSIEEVLND